MGEVRNCMGHLGLGLQYGDADHTYLDGGGVEKAGFSGRLGGMQAGFTRLFDLFTSMGFLGGT